MATDNYNIKVKADLSELTKLKNEYNEARSVLNKMIAEGKRGSQEFKDQTSKVRDLGKSINMLSRELRGLPPVAKMSARSLLEMGENITVVLAGLKATVQPFTQFIKQSITLGAELQVLRDNFKGSEKDLEGFRISTAGTVTDANLIKLSNQASDLGLSLKDQTILFSLAENAADKYGGSVEENFAGLMNSTEGATKVLKTLGIQKKVYEEAVKSLLPVGAKELEQLDAEVQKQIRIQALLKVSGETYESATNKIKDNKDVLDSVLVSYTNFQAALGESLVDFFAGQIRDATDALNNFGIGTDGATKLIVDFTKKFASHIDLLIRAVLPWTNFIVILKDVSERFKSITDSAKDTNSALGSIVSTLTQTVPTGLLDVISDAVQYAKSQVRELLYLLGVLGANTAGTGMGATKTSTQVTPNVKNTGSKGQGSRNETQKETLNLIELEQQKLAKLNTQLNANLGDIGSELQLRREILAVELEIFRLRTGQRIDLGNALNGLNSMALTNAEPLRRIIGINPRAGNDPRGDMTSDEIQAMELSFEDMKGITDGILGGFQQMLQLTGLMETDFGKMIQWLQSVINTGSSFFDIFSTIAGFIPGGSIVSGAIGAIGGGGINPMAGGMPRSGGMSFNPTVIVNSEVEKTKSIKFYQNTMPEFNRRQALKSL